MKIRVQLFFRGEGLPNHGSRGKIWKSFYASGLIGPPFRIRVKEELEESISLNELLRKQKILNVTIIEQDSD